MRKISRIRKVNFAIFLCVTFTLFLCLKFEITKEGNVVNLRMLFIRVLSGITVLFTILG